MARAVLMAFAVAGLAGHVEMFSPNMIAAKMAGGQIFQKANAQPSTKAILVATQLSTAKVSTPAFYTYKDYRSKTKVDIRPMYSTTEYDTVEYSTVDFDTVEVSTVENVTSAFMSTPLVSGTPVVVTSMASVTHDQFEWPMETQTYAVPVNCSRVAPAMTTTCASTTTTTIVDNQLPHM